MIAAAASAFLDALDPEQRATATSPFDSADRSEWLYVPAQRPGLPLRDMSESQRELALDLLRAGLSDRAFGEARQIMSREPEGRTIHPLSYYFRVFGDPAGSEPWGFSTSGHHVVVNVAVVGDTVAGTPHFFGAEPAVILSGPDAGLRFLPNEEDLARDLLGGLDDARREAAIVADVAPDDILTRNDPVADPSVLPKGLAYGDMADDQRALLERLVRHYLTRAVPEVAEAAWQRLSDTGLERVTFSWAGSTERGIGNKHYYAVQGPTFVLEYDNTQDDGNHIHSVWRDLERDWGTDLLKAHYAAGHSA
jgi:Protein of unknown function (DUF3500)